MNINIVLTSKLFVPVLLTADYGFPFFQYLGISFIVALIVALIVTSMWKSQLKSVYKSRDAANYIKAGSFKLHSKRDTFLYKELKKTEKPKDEK